MVKVFGKEFDLDKVLKKWNGIIKSLNIEIENEDVCNTLMLYSEYVMFYEISEENVNRTIVSFKILSELINIKNLTIELPQEEIEFPIHTYSVLVPINALTIDDITPQFKKTILTNLKQQINIKISKNGKAKLIPHILFKTVENTPKSLLYSISSEFIIE